MVMRVPPFLHHERAHCGRVPALLLHQLGDLVALATQPDHQHARHIGVARIAGQRAAQQVPSGSPVISMPQPMVCGNATTPSTLGKSRSRSAVKYAAIRDHRGRAVDGGQDADEVARAHAAVLADVALEGGALGFGNEVDGLHVAPERGIAFELDEPQVVRMHVVTRLDVTRRHADDGVVLAHRLAFGDGARRDLVTGRHLGACPTPNSGSGWPSARGVLATRTLSSGCRRRRGLVLTINPSPTVPSASGARSAASRGRTPWPRTCGTRGRPGTSAARRSWRRRT